MHDEFFPRIKVEMSRRSRNVAVAGVGDSWRWSVLDLVEDRRFDRGRVEGLADPGFLACLRPLGEDRQGVVRGGQLPGHDLL